MQSIELLAPAGSLEAAKAAVNAGADAVYMGGPLFSARAYAESAGTDMLSEAICYCHLRGVRIYMTLNTLMKEQEMQGLYEYLLPYYRQGLDAVIVQDLGVLRFVRVHFPDLPIHASTQMTVTGRYGAALLKRFGASRIVTARELSISEIREIHENVDIEIESFIHGALCYCYSGQCLMSSMLGGRSGNRGRCAGPCRLAYDVIDENGKLLPERGRYLLSMKDFNTLEHLPELLSAGVMSLKIEGRMKSPLYVASVVSVYRKYLNKYAEIAAVQELGDGQKACGRARRLSAKGAETAGNGDANGIRWKIDPQDERLLAEAATRAASTDGYLYAHNGKEMLKLSEKAERRPDEALLAPIREAYLGEGLRVPVSAEAQFVIGQPARLRLSCDYRDIHAAYEAVSVYPDHTVCAERAQNQGMTEERLRAALEKFGGTPFRLVQLAIQADKGLFIPVRELNELRRKAADGLSEAILGRYERT